MHTRYRSKLCLFLLLAALPALAQEKGPGVPLRVESNTFSVIRPLGYYMNRLGDGFASDLAKLGDKGHWIDGGSGEGVAIEHYFQVGGANKKAAMYAGSDVARDSMTKIGALKQEKRAYVTGITYHMLRTERPTYGNRLRHLSGRLMEDIPQKELGRADLISDVYGVYAYTNRFDKALAMYLTALKKDGSLYVFHDIRMYKTTIQVGEKEVPLFDWLGGIKGMRVERTNEGLSIRITKTGGNIEIPRLQFVSEDNQAPPIRVFRQIEGTIRVAETEDGEGPQVDFTRPTGPHRPPRAPEPLGAEVLRGMTELLGYDPMPPRRR